MNKFFLAYIDVAKRVTSSHDHYKTEISMYHVDRCSKPSQASACASTLL